METRKAATSEIKQSSEANRDLEEMLLEILHSDYSFSLAQQQQNHSTSVVNNLAYDDSLPSVDLLVGRSREPCNEELFKSIPADSLVLTEKIPTMSLPYQFLKSNSDPGPLMCDQEQSETEENCAENSSESLVQCKRLDVSAPKQYWCSVPGCGGQFTRRNNLKTHMRLHNNENPFTCNFGCGRSFKWKSSLKHHYRAHQRQALRDIKKEKEVARGKPARTSTERTEFS